MWQKKNEPVWKRRKVTQKLNQTKRYRYWKKLTTSNNNNKTNNNKITLHCVIAKDKKMYSEGLFAWISFTMCDNLFLRMYDLFWKERSK